MLVIGDIHSRYHLLLKLLAQEWDGHEHIVFLGDINDNAVECDEVKYSFLKVYHFIKALVDGGRADLIASNHQDKLCRYLKGNPVVPGHGLQSTLNEIERAGLTAKDRAEMLEWLRSRPHILYRGRHVFAHAYPTSSYKLAVYGPKTNDNKRDEWWLRADKDTYAGKAAVVGHYHKLFYSQYALVVDCDLEGIAYAHLRDSSTEMGIVT